jgi:hypothetical protein
MLGYCEENYQRRKSTAKEQKHRMCDADGTRLNIRLILIFQFSKDLEDLKLTPTIFATGKRRLTIRPQRPLEPVEFESMI